MKKYFITGLVLLLPLVITVAIVIFMVNFLTKPFIGAVTHFFETHDIVTRGIGVLSAEQVVQHGSQIAILIAIFIFTVILGMITRWFFIRTLLNWSDKILHRIPVVNTVYKTTQEIIKTVFVSDKTAFRTVVMVEFPQKGTYVLGLISRESPESCCEATGEKLFSVLIPTTPNPTTGFLLMYRESELIKVDMTPEDAVKYLVSCGVMLPKKVAKKVELPKAKKKKAVKKK